MSMGRWMQPSSPARQAFFAALVLIGAVGLWALACQIFSFPPYLLPGPGAVAEKFVIVVPPIWISVAVLSSVPVRTTSSGMWLVTLLGVMPGWRPGSRIWICC